MRINKKIIINLVILGVLLILVCYFLDFIGYKCLFRKLLNIYCPGCGSTRMIKSIFKFEFYRAFRYNPLMFLLIILFLFLMTSEYLYYLIKCRLFDIPKKCIIIILIIIVLYFIFRNIEVFNFLKPFEY